MKRSKSVIGIALVTAALGTLSPVSTATAARPECSAADLEGFPHHRQDRLPRRVARMREEIVDAAVRCDYRRLQRLAKQGKNHFTFSFGAERSPARYWARLERHGGDPMAKLVRLFDADFTRGRHAYPHVRRARGNYVWPSVFRPHATRADWKSLRKTNAYSRREMRRFRRDRYLGYRMIMSRRGDWTIFVSGD